MELIQQKQSNSIKQANKFCSPDSLLKKLLSKREKVPSRRTKAEYKVNNPTVTGYNADETIRLKDAFCKLENHRNADPLLMKQARRAYLSSLVKPVNESLFEKQYLTLQRYMDVTSDIPDLSKLERVFTEIMKEQCRYQIECIIKTFHKEPRPRQENGYLDKLICNAALWRAQQGIKCFEDAQSLVLLFSDMVDSGKKLDGKYTMVHIPISDNKEYVFLAEIPPYTKRKRYFLRLQEFFKHYWVFAGHSIPVDGVGHFLDIESIANEFACGARAAAEFLGGGKGLVCSVEDTKELLQYCENSVTQEDGLIPAHTILHRIDVTDASFTINPLAAPAAGGGLAAAQQLLSALHSAFRMGPRANVALQRAAISYLSQAKNPSLTGLLGQMNTVEKKRAGLLAAIEPLDLLSSLIHCGNRPISIDLEQAGIVALGFDQVVDSKFRTLLVELILQAVWNQWISVEHSVNHPLILMMDECQNLAWGENSMAVRILREGRKFGIGGWFSSQWISNKTAVAALGQAALQANFRPEDANIAALSKRLAQSEGTASRWQGLIRKLRVGQFLCSRQDGKTILIHVPSRR